MIKRIIIALMVNIILLYYIFSFNQDSESALSDTSFILSLINILISVSFTLGRKNGYLGSNSNWLSFATVTNLFTSKKEVQEYHKIGNLREIMEYSIQDS